MPPNDLMLFRNVTLSQAAVGDASSSTAEPSIANNGRQVLMTGNWFASKSLDDGNNWQFINPDTFFPRALGARFCCDQQTIYCKSRDFFAWLLQYRRNNAGVNVQRLAIKLGDTLNNNAGWYWWDFSPGDLRDDWADFWFDYPDLAISDDFLYFTSNVFENRSFRGAAVVRISLDDLITKAGFSYRHFTTTANGSLRLTQGAGPVMYWFSHEDRDTVRLFEWAENSNQINWYDRNISQFNGATPYTPAPGPDGRDWMGFMDWRHTGAWVGKGIIGCAWTSNAFDAFPFPHVRIVKIDERTKNVVAQPVVWSSSGAWAFPGCAANARGDMGMSLFFGGPQWGEPAHVVRVDDEFGTAIRVARYGTHGPPQNRWGDYVVVRPHSPDDYTWIATGYTMQGGATLANVAPGYVHFGRRRDARAAARWDDT